MVKTHLGRPGRIEAKVRDSTNAYNLGNKEDLGLLMQTEVYDLVGITET